MCRIFSFPASVLESNLFHLFLVFVKKFRVTLLRQFLPSMEDHFLSIYKLVLLLLTAEKLLPLCKTGCNFLRPLLSHGLPPIPKKAPSRHWHNACLDQGVLPSDSCPEHQ
jgi:hypothetical protein